MTTLANAKFRSLVSVLIMGLLIAGGMDTVSAIQNEKPSEKKREKFGSSLKRLKWDKEKQTAVDKQEIRSPSIAVRSDDDAIKLDTTLISFEATVMRRGTVEPILDLKRGDFVLTEEGRPQQIEMFTRGDDADLPRSIILIIDWSGSQYRYLPTSIAAAKTLVSKLNPSDEMAIVTDDIDLLIDFTTDKHKLSSTLDSILSRSRGPGTMMSFGKSRQFTALFSALRELVDGGQRRPIIIFQTDGDEAPTFRDQDLSGQWSDSPKNFGLGDIFSAAEKSRATIYSVITAERSLGRSYEDIYDRFVQERFPSLTARADRDRFLRNNRPLTYRLKQWADLFAAAQKATATVANLSGGWSVFLESPDQADEIYTRILLDINQRYIIGYYPTTKVTDGRLHKVQIEVRGHPEYEVHGKTSYLAPSRP